MKKRRNTGTQEVIRVPSEQEENMLKSVSLRIDEELHRKIKKFAASRRLNFTQAFILILESTRIVVLEEGVEILNCLNRLDESIKAKRNKRIKARKYRKDM